MRTTYDLEMLREIGTCSGIENYSRFLDGREAGQMPYTLLDYFPDDFLCVLDESHVTVPQGDARRARLPAPVRARQPAPAVQRVHRAREPGGLHVSHAGGVRAREVQAGRRAD